MICQEIERFYPEHREKVRVDYNGYDPEVYFPPRESKTGLRESLGLPAAGILLSGWSRKGLATSEQLQDQAVAHHPSVLPMPYNLFSNACLEALACGFPVIKTQKNGVAEVLAQTHVRSH